MSISPRDFLKLADEVQKRLDNVRNGIYNLDANYLLLGTCAQESHLGEYRRQIGMSGYAGAFGIMEIEMATVHLIHRWCSRHAPELGILLRNTYEESSVKLGDGSTLVCSIQDLDALNLMYNDAYSIMLARILYYSIPYPLPSRDDIYAMGVYWDKYYNRNPNKGTPEEFVESYKTFVEPYL